MSHSNFCTSVFSDFVFRIYLVKIMRMRSLKDFVPFCSRQCSRILQCTALFVQVQQEKGVGLKYKIFILESVEDLILRWKFVYSNIIWLFFMRQTRQFCLTPFKKLGHISKGYLSNVHLMLTQEKWWQKQFFYVMLFMPPEVPTSIRL